MTGKKNKQILGTGDPPHFIRALELLSQSGAEYLIVGGVAANLHGLSRGTRDIDVLIPKELENTKKILKALENLTWGLSKELFAEDVISKPFTIIGDMPRVDLLLRAGKLSYEQAKKNQLNKKIGTLNIPTISIDDLILSKDTNRERDQLEIIELKKLKKLSKT